MSNSQELFIRIWGEIYNAGFLDLYDMYIDENNSRQNGGGIYNGGTMQGNEIEIIKNITGPGYDGYSYSFGAPGIDGESPDGGGIFNAGFGQLVNVKILDNFAGDGGKGSERVSLDQSGKGGDGGSGGGVNNSGILEIYLGDIVGNQTGKGGEAGQWRENGSRWQWWRDL